MSVLPRDTAPRTKVCTRCKQDLPWEAYYAHSKWPDGTMRYPYSRCIECWRLVRLEHNRRHRAEDPERHREHSRRSRARIRKDPEAAAEMRVYKREYYRRTHNVPPERYVVDRHDGAAGTVETLPIRTAVLLSGVSMGQIAARAGYANEGAIRHPIERDTMQLRTAKRILAAIDVLPAEVGL